VFLLVTVAVSALIGGSAKRGLGARLGRRRQGQRWLAGDGGLAALEGEVLPLGLGEERALPETRSLPSVCGFAEC
jgi:hypothetical protein